MPARMNADPADMVARVGKHWGWVLAFGIVTVLLGIIALAWPGRTLIVVAVLFGAQLIVMGIFRFVNAIATDELPGSSRVLLALLGVLSLIVGLYAVRHLLVTLFALVVLLGIFWVVSGAIELFMALSHREMGQRGWTAIMGGISVVAGIIVLAYPSISLLVLAVLLSIWLIIFGVMEISIAVRLRSLSTAS
ncbi:MAG: HdeD family acid-resistance protein [Streptosporangiaceae bacterium]